MRPCRNIAAIAWRELYSYFASPIAYVFLVIFLGICGAFTFQLGHIFERNEASLGASFFVWHPWLFMIFVPAVGMRLWAEERRSGTMELIFTLPLQTWEAVVGKFVAGGLFLGLSLACTFPIVVTVGYLGHPDYRAIASGYLGSFLVALGFLALSSLTSALTRNQIVSFILSLVLCLFLILGGYPPVTTLALQWGAPNWLVTAIASISVVPHYDAMQRGVIDSRDLIYYGSLLLFGMFGTTVLVKDR